MTADRAREMLIEAYSADTMGLSLEQEAMLQGIEPALRALTKALQSADEVRAALSKIADMTDVEADFDGFEARRIAQDAIRSAPSRSGGGEGHG